MMDKAVFPALIGFSGLIIGAVLTFAFQMVRDNMKVKREREDYLLSHFLNKRAEVYDALFKVYDEVFGKVLKASILDPDPIVAFKTFKPVRDFLGRNLIYPSDNVAEIALRFPMGKGQEYTDIRGFRQAAVLAYNDLRKAIRAELGEEFVPKKSAGDEVPENASG